MYQKLNIMPTLKNSLTFGQTPLNLVVSHSFELAIVAGKR